MRAWEVRARWGTPHRAREQTYKGLHVLDWHWTDRRSARLVDGRLVRGYLSEPARKALRIVRIGDTINNLPSEFARFLDTRANPRKRWRDAEGAFCERIALAHGGFLELCNDRLTTFHMPEAWNDSKPGKGRTVRGLERRSPRSTTTEVMR